MRHQHLPGGLRPHEGSRWAKRIDRATCPAARDASDQETLKQSVTTRPRMDMRVWRLPSTRDRKERDGFAVTNSHDAGCQRRPRYLRHSLGRYRRTMTAFATVTVHGNERCRTGEFSQDPRSVIRIGCRLFVIMAACVAFDRLDRMRHAVAPSSAVTRVQAAAEGEMNHRRDGCDDADERSHGRCLS